MSKVKKHFWDDYRFEFNLYINKNIICQRKFNVKNYNKKVLKSLELKEMIDNITSVNINEIGDSGILPKYLKKQCRDFSWRQYRPWRLTDNRNAKPLFLNEDLFTFEVKIDKRVVAKSSFSGNWFQTDVRYAVDVREVIPDIISELEYYMSMEEYTIVETLNV